MNVFGKDALIGDYRLSDHGLMLATFNVEDTYNLGVSMDTSESFLGRNPVPVYLGSKFNAKAQLTVTVIQNEPVTKKTFFTVNEVREILGRLTGFQGYKKMYVQTESLYENFYYMVRVNEDVDFERSGDKIIGIRFVMDCDSQFAWKDEEQSFITENADDVIKIDINSDDRYNYLLPYIELTTDSALDSLSIINITDNNRETKIDNINANETIIIDSKRNIISSTRQRNFSEDFNYKFPRLLNGENELQISSPITIKFSMNLPRKVGMF